MTLDGYRLQPVKVTRLSDTTLQMDLYEGRNRQIRRMCEQVGLRVTRLQRVAIGELVLGTLPVGKWRELSADEVHYLYTNNKEGK
jgi:pseudouridine synthase